MDMRETLKMAAVPALAILLALVAAEAGWLHARCVRQDAALQALSARLATAEAQLAEMDVRQTKVAALAQSLEKWVETSSVEGRFKAYRKQAGEEYRALTGKLRDLKNAAAEGLKTMCDELKKD